MIRCRDVVILCASFSFTIAVACFMILYINDNQCQNALEIEKIVEKILIERDLQLSKTVERNFDAIKDEDVERSKRAINDYRVQKHVNTGGEGSVVEFFNPRLRPELEKNDTEIMKKSGLKGAAPKGDSWVWLTSYSRIPFEAIEGFCKKTKEYCPPGPAGS
ncbi:CLUMA_CG014954, isoform A [Clunio marinus]|uniref:CLUMA_CG014954, isoform A n=1 Tax=Clunio marinus TaxID=568069 RepID=A0A1J1IPU1_9DIPT|nr:CLUMA_CG014954, isoform A [Clunio marinus]